MLHVLSCGSHHFTHFFQMHACQAPRLCYGQGIDPWSFGRSLLPKIMLHLLLPLARIICCRDIWSMCSPPFASSPPNLCTVAASWGVRLGGGRRPSGSSPSSCPFLAQVLPRRWARSVSTRQLVAFSVSFVSTQRPCSLAAPAIAGGSLAGQERSR